jgi:EpsI family protein
MLIRTIVLTTLFLTTLGLVARASKSETVQVRASFDTFPMQIEGWKGREEPPFSDDVLAVLGVDDYLTRTYSRVRGGVGLYIGYWGTQSQGDTIHSPLNCIPGSGWQPLSKGALQLDVSEGVGAAPRQVSINRYVIQKGLDRQLVLYWYQSHGRVVANEYVGKFYLVKDAIELNRTDAAIVRVIVPITVNDPDGVEAERTGVEFVKSLFPVLNGYLPA